MILNKRVLALEKRKERKKERKIKNKRAIKNERGRVVILLAFLAALVSDNACVQAHVSSLI